MAKLVLEIKSIKLNPDYLIQEDGKVYSKKRKQWLKPTKNGRYCLNKKEARNGHINVFASNLLVIHWPEKYRKEYPFSLMTENEWKKHLEKIESVLKN